jgi:tartrate/fumarate subfamily iron-sulfur-dependent hydro-lyase alpha chain
MMIMITVNDIIGLYRKAAIELPSDIVNGLTEASRREKEGRPAKWVLTRILENIENAKSSGRPICQDTGVPVFYVSHGRNHTQHELRSVIAKATDAATREVPLRPNAVDPLTGKNVGNRPLIHFEGDGKDGNPRVDLMLKGGGSENVSAIHHLPDKGINADRNLDGIGRCVLDAVFKAQGKACPPYVIGVAVGGSAEEVMYLSKKQLLRKLNDSNPEKMLDRFEKEMLEKVNELGIGPMGLGGKTTALAVKAASSYRNPASYVVGVTFGCWCMRRQSL